MKVWNDSQHIVFGTYQTSLRIFKEAVKYRGFRDSELNISVEDFARNPTYMSGEIKNEILEILEERIVKRILEELGDRVCNVLFDGTTGI